MSYRTARQLVAALGAGEVTSAQLVDQAIARIEGHDGAINAVAVRDFARARTAAAAADKALARGERGALLGLPITVKEAMNVAGLPTTWGLPNGDRSPVSADGAAVARLRAAGAIILGKTNVPVMLADWQSFNPIYGVTSNPWDHTRTAGGSSGGGAAALAAGFVSLELGSDLVNSLRAPAHFCGVFAHKPTYGLVPTGGFAPPGTPADSDAPPIDFAVLGPMARSADDLALALDVLAGPDPADAAGQGLRLAPPRHTRLRDFRVLVVDEHPMLPTAAVIREALSQLGDRLAQTGCPVARHSPLLPDLAALTGSFNKLLPALFGADLPVDDRARAERVRAEIAEGWRQLFAEWDVVLCPVMPTPAFPHDHGDMEARRLLVDGKAIPYQSQPLWGPVATFTGLPATALPIGWSDDGLPIGAQVIGPLVGDRTTIGFAGMVERAFGGFREPPRYISAAR